MLVNLKKLYLYANMIKKLPKNLEHMHNIITI